MAESTKFEIDVSLYTEATHAPWWVIVNPKFKAKTIDCVEGPFFSREEAERALHADRHLFGAKARVWCLMANRNSQYYEQWCAYRANGGKLPPESEQPK